MLFLQLLLNNEALKDTVSSEDSKSLMFGNSHFLKNRWLFWNNDLYNLILYQEINPLEQQRNLIRWFSQE